MQVRIVRYAKHWIKTLPTLTRLKDIGCKLTVRKLECLYGSLNPFMSLAWNKGCQCRLNELFTPLKKFPTHIVDEFPGQQNYIKIVTN